MGYMGWANTFEDPETEELVQIPVPTLEMS